MNNSGGVPGFLKRWFRGIVSVYRTVFERKSIKHRSLAETQEFWKDPWDGNAPKDYLHQKERSEFLLRIIREQVSADAKILEIGCNVGRNLAHLYDAGYTNLTAVEISQNALDLLRESYPEMGASIRLLNASVEEAIKEFDDSEFDLVFTMAVLEHIHEDSDWIFADMVRITKSRLITVEDERCQSWRHFPRNYKDVFESLGVKELKSVDVAKDGTTDLPEGFVARVFGRN